MGVSIISDSRSLILFVKMSLFDNYLKFNTPIESCNRTFSRFQIVSGFTLLVVSHSQCYTGSNHLVTSSKREKANRKKCKQISLFPLSTPLPFSVNLLRVFFMCETEYFDICLDGILVC